MTTDVPNSQVRSRGFCFTVNNPEFEPDFDATKLRYLVYGREVAPSTGTVHYQGYIYFHNPQRFNTVRNHPGLETAHIEVAKGSPEQNRAYCTKEGNFKEFGEIPNQGKRNDLGDAISILRSQPNRSGLKRVLEEHPAAFVRYHRGLEKAIEIMQPEVPKPPYEELREWQTELMDVIEEQSVHPRHILFFVDPVGGQGKSFMCRLIMSLYPEKTLILSNAKHDRLYHTYSGQTIIIFDMTRSLSDEQDNLPYAVMENMKNGYKPPGMYGTPPAFYSIPHVIVFTNHSPNMNALSHDRYSITTLSQNNAY